MIHLYNSLLLLSFLWLHIFWIQMFALFPRNYAFLSSNLFLLYCFLPLGICEPAVLIFTEEFNFNYRMDSQDIQFLFLCLLYTSSREQPSAIILISAFLIELLKSILYSFHSHTIKCSIWTSKSTANIYWNQTNNIQMRALHTPLPFNGIKMICLKII